MSQTKKDYENYLSEIYPSYEPFMDYLCIGSKQTKNALNRGSYGFILRKKDPIAFEVGFSEWKQKEN